jgi:UDP-sulfoquinovose synthase
MNPANQGEFRVFNQFTESFSVLQFAEMVRDAYNKPVEIQHGELVRVEKEDHYYNAIHTRLLDLGLQPHLLNKDTLEKMLAMTEKYAHRIDPAAFKATVNWRNTTNYLPTSGSPLPR